MSDIPEGGNSTCTYNPTYYAEVVDRSQDCTQAAEWHIRISGAGVALDGFFAACAEHTPQAFNLDAGDGKRQFHEYGSGCGVPGSYWHERHNSCTTLETALVAGIFWYECPDGLPSTAGLAIGAYARFKDQWFRVTGPHQGFAGTIWLACKPPPGWTPGETHTFQPEV